MFATHALLPPPTFAVEPRPLRLTSEEPCISPSSECRFILLHPSAQNQRCSCKSFRHNRSTVGLICDCGHKACYHVHGQAPAQAPVPDTFHAATLAALAERVRRLEEALQDERRRREDAVLEERQAREREIMILREALHPFYRSEEEMRRKLVELEDRVEGNYDEHIRVKERCIALDDQNMTLEKRVEDLEDSRSKRRRISRPGAGASDGSYHRVTGKPPSGPSSADDALPVKASSSPSLTPNGRAMSRNIADDEPRSSGILNLMDLRKPSVVHPPLRWPPTPPQYEEARSSGFLALDLAERFALSKKSRRNDAAGPPRNANSASPHAAAAAPAPAPVALTPLPISAPPYHDDKVAPLRSGTGATTGEGVVSIITRGHTNGYLKTRSTDVQITEVYLDNERGKGVGWTSQGPKPNASLNTKRKRDAHRSNNSSDEFIALDVLANMSAAATMV